MTGLKQRQAPHQGDPSPCRLGRKRVVEVALFYVMSRWIVYEPLLPLPGVQLRPELR